MKATGSPTWDNKRRKYRVFVGGDDPKNQVRFFDTRQEADDFFFEESGINGLLNNSRPNA